MRRSISKLPYGLPTAPSSIAVYSTSSGGGGRGRGGGAPIPKFQFPAPSDTSKNPNPNPNPVTPPRPQGHGRGRGSVLPSFASFLNNDSAASSGRAPIGEPSDLPPPKPNLKMPFFAFANGEQPQLNPAESEEASLSQQNSLPGNIFSILSTTGRGKPVKSPPPQPRSETQPIRATEQKQKQPTKLDSPKPQLSQEEKVRKAVEVLSRGGGAGPGDYRGVRAEGGGGGGGGGGGRGGGRGGRGGRGSGRGGYGGRGTQVARFNEEQDDGPTGMFFGDPADEEKVAKKFGPELMAKLAEGFEEMSDRVLPNPREEALLEAYETNLRFECDPEWFMENFATNPDIDEKPQIPLRVALEKMKPFLMAYEGIDSHEEWEEIMEETMEKVPLMKEIIDHYGGSDRATAKQQQEELKHVAETLPASAPASVKRFADRAVLSLQSNPGWGYDRKCQFMDKLIMEVSQQYK